MQKSSLAIGILAGALLAGAAFYIYDEELREDDVQHYAVAKPANEQAAFALFESAFAKVETIVQAPTLDGTALEAIHEQSYALKAAVEYLEDQRAYKHNAALDAVEEAVEELHEASEDHEQDKVRVYFSQLQNAWAQLQVTPAEAAAAADTHEHHDHSHAHDDHAHSHDAAAPADRVEHYEAAKPTSVEGAAELFETAAAKISAILTTDKLDGTALEAIHEHSYALEAAVDYLEDVAPYKGTAAVKALEDAVEGVHEASEDHHEAQVRSWYGKMQAAWVSLPRPAAAQ